MQKPDLVQIACALATGAALATFFLIGLILGAPQ
jgi:hypothetical protein